MNFFNPDLQLKDTEFRIKDKLIDLVCKLKDYKFMAELVLEFRKLENDDTTKYSTFYSNSKAETTINESDIDDVFESIYSTIISDIQKSLRNRSGWIIDSVLDHTINITSKTPSLAEVISNYQKNYN